jgi:hypothetical protein
MFCFETDWTPDTRAPVFIRLCGRPRVTRVEPFGLEPKAERLAEVSRPKAPVLRSRTVTLV